MLAPALVAALQDKTPSEVHSEPESYGRWAENAVGAQLLRAGLEVFYWRDRDLELDFIAKKGSRVIAFEVSISDRKSGGENLDRLARKCGASKAVLVGPNGIAMDDFLRADPMVWFAEGRRQGEPDKKSSARQRARAEF
ncbi:MAG: DUF4143 domain-containing protein [Elusimicrobia bacterium]|nr:DUF4143 domain-containing protein [Elusimicrobiota bacterium]